MRKIYAFVAPIFTPENRRSVYLPEGTWLDYNDLSRQYEGKQTKEVEVPLDQTPVFVKGNSIYVTGNIISGNSRQWVRNFDQQKSLTVHAFAGQPGEKANFDYVDAGEDDQVKGITLATEDSQLIFTAEPLSLGGEIRIKCADKPKKVILNQKKIKYRYDKESGVLSVEFPKNNTIGLKVIL